MRYFLDTEYDGFGGKLLSIALVPEDGGEEFYAVIEHDGVASEWVARHVVPFLDMVPEPLKGPRLAREDAADALARWLEHDEAPDIVADWPEDALKARPLDAYTALVAVTHDPKIDDFPIISALRSRCFYVGALGSRKTHAKRAERLLAEGVSEAQIARIDAPIGLDIGAQSPAEIAVAVLGAIIQAFRKREIRS